MTLYNDIVEGKTSISLIGLGYVGLPIAIAFSRKVSTIGFDVNVEKINLYKSGVDPTKEVGNEVVKNTTLQFTSNENDLKNAKFHIVAVPTPVKSDNTPDLIPIQSASRTLGRNLVKGAIVVYESTVYPGVTEEICVPILEKESGLKCGVDFKVGYSPERINPGDKEHRLENIIKVVAGMDKESLDVIADVYSLVVEAGVYKAESIKVAEAAKVIENSQRDINIAFMNELSIIFNKMNIDTKSVLEAASTKWNFLNFTPGLVGGHCIGVDPYYLTYKAQELGYHSQIILAGRRINDSMGKYVAETLIKKLIQEDISIKGSKVGILGFTFKENCPDTRNTKIMDIVLELRDYGIEPVIVDPQADKDEAYHEYGIEFSTEEDLIEMDAIILAVAHDEFKNYTASQLSGYYKGNKTRKILLDLKSVFDKDLFNTSNFNYWRL